MSEIDDFAGSLLEEAKCFLEKAEATDDQVARAAFLHAALMLAFCALEAHVNATADELSIRQELSIHERGFLLEKDVRFENGEFRLGGLRMIRLEDRILFLHRKFGGVDLDRSASWWSDLASATTLRNQLTHPKCVPTISVEAVRVAVQAVIVGIDILFRAIYRRPFPVATRGLRARITF